MDIISSKEFTNFLGIRNCLVSGTLNVSDILYGIKFFLPFHIYLRQRNDNEKANANSTKTVQCNRNVFAMILEIKIQPVEDSKMGHGGLLWILALFRGKFYFDAKTLLFDMMCDAAQRNNSKELTFTEDLFKNGVLSELVFRTPKTPTTTKVVTMQDLLVHKEPVSIQSFPWPMMCNAGTIEIQQDAIKALTLNADDQNYKYLGTLLQWHIDPYRDSKMFKVSKSWRLNEIYRECPAIVDHVTESSDAESSNRKNSRKSVRIAASQVSNDIQVPQKKDIEWVSNGLFVVVEDLYGNTCSYLHPHFMQLVYARKEDLVTKRLQVLYRPPESGCEDDSDDIRQLLIRSLKYIPTTSGQVWTNLKTVLPVMMNCPYNTKDPYSPSTYMKASESLLKSIKSTLQKDTWKAVNDGVFRVNDMSVCTIDYPSNAKLVWTMSSKGADIYVRLVSKNVVAISN